MARLDALLSSASDDPARAGLLHEKGDLYQLAGHTDRAIESYQEALNYDPTNWVTLNNIAYLLSDIRGANEAALPFATKAVALEDNAFTLDTLGWIYVGLGRFPLAVAELSRAVRVNPDYALSYYHLGEAYRRNAQFTEAVDILKDGQELSKTLKDEALTTLIDASLARTAKRDAAP
jgi:tetratricopeptide (TPR) repeat protein